MLDLGLARISKLVTASRLPWRAIHVAGTNGKGSVCSYVSSMLRAAKLDCGQFTSPHLIDRWDCISCNGHIIDKHDFDRIGRDVSHRSIQQEIDATEFELLTATAFEAFTQRQVDIGVVEVGVGGRLDATNILQSPLATVITSIGMDHQSLLGDTIEQIAYEKAGIIKRNAPCFADGMNPPNVKEVLRERARSAASEICFVKPDEYQDTLWSALDKNQFSGHQQMNIALAFEASRSALRTMNVTFEDSVLAKAAARTIWPGRLQPIDLSPIASHTGSTVIDGAHNPQAALALGEYVSKNLQARPGNTNPITWVIGMTKGKDVKAVIKALLRPEDNVVTVAFGPVDGMPWVEPLDALELSRLIKSSVPTSTCESFGTVKLALEHAAEIAGPHPLVVTGSLYLISDILRLHRDAVVSN